MPNQQQNQAFNKTMILSFLAKKGEKIQVKYQSVQNTKQEFNIIAQCNLVKFSFWPQHSESQKLKSGEEI